MASAPTLINSVEVSEITASKITAGTIGAHEIILTQPGTQTSYTPPSSTAVLRSSNYSVGTAGWLIRGDGLAEFNDLTVRTRLDIGGDDASSFHVDNNGNMWLGAGISSYSTAPFRVSNTGALVASNANVSGTINASAGTINNTVTIGTNSSSKISIVGTSTANTTAIYSGTSSYGSGGFWIDASGRFSLGDKLAFNGTDLSIAGTVTIGGTLASTVRDGAASGASSLQPGGAASDVNNNVTNISGSKIRTGTIDSNNFNWAGNTTYSIDGTRLDLINGEIISKKFRIDSAGNATFGGTLSSASGSVGAGFSIGGSLSIGDNVRVNGATGDGGATVFKVRGATSSSTTNFIAKFQNNAPDDIMSIRDDGLVDVSASFRYKGQVYSMASDGYAQFGAVGAPGSVGGRVFRINQAETLWDRSLSTSGSRPVYVNSDSTLFCGTTVSSLRYKNNITNSVIDTKSFLELDVVDFYYNDEFYEDPLKKTKELGVIAEQVHEKGLIDLVRYDNEGRPDGLNENKIPFYLLKACIDQQKKIDELELRLHSLENM